MTRSLIQRTHAVGPREALDRVILILSFVIGAGGGVLLKLLNVNPFYAALYAAGVLITYAVATYFATPLQIEPETIGDNCYYLGFLFTLTSLSVTLYFVVEAGVDRRAELIPEVISGFGVALSSTIVGVFLRVFMMQIRVDIVSREKQVRADMDIVARELREEMARGLRQFKSFSIESQQLVREREAAMVQHSDALLDEARIQMRKSTERMGEVIETATREQTSAAMSAIQNQASITVAEISTMIRTASENIMHSVSSDIAAMAAERATLTNLRSAVTGDLEKIGTTLATTNQEMVLQSQQLAQSLEQSSKEFKHITQNLGDSIQTTVREQAAVAMDAILSEASSASIDLTAKIHHATGTILDSLSEEASALSSGKKALTELRSEISRDLATLQESLSEASKNMTSTLEHATSEYEHSAGKLGEAAEELAQDLSALPVGYRMDFKEKSGRRKPGRFKRAIRSLNPLRR